MPSRESASAQEANQRAEPGRSQDRRARSRAARLGTPPASARKSRRPDRLPRPPLRRGLRRFRRRGSSTHERAKRRHPDIARRYDARPRQADGLQGRVRGRRLHLDPTERRRITAQFGDGARIRYKLSPPILRALGINRKVAVGRWFDPAFALCIGCASSAAPLSTRSATRNYANLNVRYPVNTAPSSGTPYRASRPDPPRHRDLRAPRRSARIRDVKLRNIEAFRTQAAQLTAELSRQGP